MNDKLKRMYEAIPESGCKAGCFECCTNIIQFTEAEKQNMGGYEYRGVCSHLVDGKCTVYDRRPLVCRIFGTSEILKCKDCTADTFLSAEDTRSIMKEYALMMKAEKTK